MSRFPKSSWSAVGALLLCLSAALVTAGSPTTRPATAAALPAEHVVAPEARTDPPGPPEPGTPVPDPERGVVFQGLHPSLAGGPCAGEYEVVDRKGPAECSHGPDPAPAGVDVRAPRRTEDLVAAGAGAPDVTAAATPTPSIQCYGDGVSGNRIQAVYAHAADVPDRSASLVASLVAYADHVDTSFADSAAETGGVRHVRWVTDVNCKPVIERVQLSAAGDDSLSNTKSELASLGFNRVDRHYLVWVDANVYCGIGTISNDDRPTADNANNSGSHYARVDSGCWGYTTSVIEAHELMHNLGGVQLSAPHSSGGWHCTDESDRMCYDDGRGGVMTNVCPAAHERLFDCNHDDYFSTAAPLGSYLRTHWNAADSSFLEKVNGSTSSTTTTKPLATTTTRPPPPSTTTTRPPATTTTTRPTTTTTTTAPPGARVVVAYATTSSWGSGYNAQVDVTNTGVTTVNGWVLKFKLSSATINLAWDGNYSVAADGTISVSDAGWNATIGAGQKASFGFGASGQSSVPTSCTFNGSPCSFSGTA